MLNHTNHTVVEKEGRAKKALTSSQHLQKIINDYIESHTGLTVNGMSKRCGVSEATLRRVCSGKNKNLPTLTTVISVLSYISKKNTLPEIIEQFSGPLSESLKNGMHTHKNSAFMDSSVNLSSKLQDPVRYMIYKLAANTNGVTASKISELFGLFGGQKLDDLLNEDLLILRGDSYHAAYSNYSLSHETFTTHFKATADFIKPEKLDASPQKYSQVFVNMSESINLNAYSSILKVQRAALKKIREIMFDSQNKGEIPAFMVSAIDTISTKSAFEIETKSSKKSSAHH